MYGSGWFGAPNVAFLLQLWNPLSATFVQWVTEYASTFRDLKAAEGDDYVPYDIYPDRPGLLPCGYGDSRRHLFYLTVGEPDDWPVLVRTPEAQFQRFDGPATGFLLDLFSGKLNSLGGERDGRWFKARRKQIAFAPVQVG